MGLGLGLGCLLHLLELASCALQKPLALLALGHHGLLDHSAPPRA